MNRAEELYKEIKKPLEQVLVSIYGMDFSFTTIDLHTDGGFAIKVFGNTRPDGSYFVDCVETSGFHKEITSNRREFKEEHA